MEVAEVFAGAWDRGSRREDDSFPQLVPRCPRQRRRQQSRTGPVHGGQVEYKAAKFLPKSRVSEHIHLSKVPDIPVLTEHGRIMHLQAWVPAS